MDNRNRLKINVTDINEASRSHSARRVPLGPTDKTEPVRRTANRQPQDNTRQQTQNAASQQPAQSGKKLKKPLTKFRRISIAVLVIGLVALVAGLGFLLWQMFGASRTSDADFLVEVGTWQRQDAPSVIWDFTELGQGQLTTNDHTNDYAFTWSIDGSQLKIDTDWLYTMHDAYDYDLNQTTRELTITKDDETITFKPLD